MPDPKDAIDAIEDADVDTARRSRLNGGGLVLLQADLHNHSLLSDGLGDPEQAFVQMRAAGLDVAALTDHASIPHHRIEDLELAQYPDEDALELARLAPRSFDEEAWRRTGEIADQHDVPGRFTALRGFEWTEPWLGHVNVWFSDHYLTVTTPGTLEGLHGWLATVEPQALFGYNHPGREPGRLHDFAGPEAAQLVGSGATALTGRMVALELFNRTHDYLFAGYRDGLTSPVVDCLDAGWRPGAIGCSDEHGRSYGLVGRGRTGVWAREHSRDGVREALLARRTFATREVGLRLDATLDGVRMGGVLDGAASRHELAVDVGGSSYEGAEAELQLLVGDDKGMPAVAATGLARLGEVTRTEVQLPEGTAWVLLRVADRGRVSDTPGPPEHPASSWALAYSSPWWWDRV